MNATLFSSGFKPEPYWWDDVPRPSGGELPLPGEADVVVVGSGYTGLHAAIEAARAGRRVVVLDAEALGWGCSSRNGGQVSTSIKGTYDELAGRYGHGLAVGLLREGRDALDFLERFITENGLDCDWRRSGRFHGAHTAGRYEAIAANLQATPAEVGIDAHMVPRAEQHAEIGSDLYHGGVVFPRYGGLHPARYHRGLLALARADGVELRAHCPVTAIGRGAGGFEVSTPHGSIRAGQVAVATNGYTAGVTPWLRRRVIPIGSYIIATEPLDPEVARALSPRGRMLTDSRRVVVYYRLSPDGRSMLFGGRVALSETDPRVSAPRLARAMCRVFPQLRGVRLSHSWAGFVAYTFDHLPHIGEHDGVHYAMGYCGAGVGLASYYGMRMGQRIAGTSREHSALDDVAFQTRPLYTGRPWFLGPSILYYRTLDRLGL